MTYSIIKRYVFLMAFALAMSGCKNQNKSEEQTKATVLAEGTFGYDRVFLQKHYTNSLVLKSEDGKAMVVVTPELQGRVMTSTLEGDEGMGFGWLNHELIASKEAKKQFNPVGGEERFWLGPEGGQFSLFFKPGSTFDFANWQVPAFMDTDVFNLLEKNDTKALFQKEIAFVNHSGTPFKIDVKREVSLLNTGQALQTLGLDNNDVSVVAYQTKNTVTNIGEAEWNQDSGLVSIWMLCMLNPSPQVTVVAPIQEGIEDSLGVRVNDNYFGKVSEERLKTSESHVFFKADGKSRGKIGFTPKRATKYIGSYDALNKVLTILEIDSPKATDNYVNSAWEIQEHPFSGDVLNSYNDGPLEDGSQMGPFYELESSSPALALKPQEAYAHTQRMYHFKGKAVVLNQISEKVLGVSIETIEKVF